MPRSRRRTLVAGSGRLARCTSVSSADPTAAPRPEFVEVAEELGTALAGAGAGLVYGGGAVGLMGAVADAVLNAGGAVIGVMPESLVAREIAHRGLTELRVTHSMHERKAEMAALADAFVALPGGLGTFEELCEILTWAQLGLHNKPVVLLDVADYWAPFVRPARRRRRRRLPAGRPSRPGPARRTPWPRLSRCWHRRRRRRCTSGSTRCDSAPARSARSIGASARANGPHGAAPARISGSKDVMSDAPAPQPEGEPRDLGCLQGDPPHPQGADLHLRRLLPRATADRRSAQRRRRARRRQPRLPRHRLRPSGQRARLPTAS